MRQLVYKLALVAIFSVILGFNLRPTVVKGQENTKPQDMARYYPSSVQGFASFRIDKASVDQLDGIMKLALSPFARQVPQLSFREAFTAATGQNADEFLSWLGDYMSIGMTSSADNFLIVSVIVDIKDVNAARAFVRSRLPHYTERALNDYVLFTDPSSPRYNSYTIELIGSHMVISPGNTGIGEFPLSQTLQEDEAFQRAVGSLPASTYGSIIYAGWNWPSQIWNVLFPASGGGDQGLEARLRTLGIEPDVANAAPLAIGLTVLDDNTLIIDTAQLPKSQTPRPQTIDPTFMHFVPSDVDAVVHGTNLTALYQNTAATVNDIVNQNASLGGTQRNIVSEFEGLISQFGIDIQNDLLSWTTGDYAIFARADVLPIAEAAVQGRIEVNDRYDFGIVIQATNPSAAQAFVDRLGRTLLRNAPPAVIIAGDQVNNVNVTKVTMNLPVSRGEIVTIELVMGTVDNVFFLATPRMVQSITARGSSLADLPEYQDSSRYFLSQPTFVWYTNGQGLITSAVMNPISAVIGLLNIAPATGTIFTVNAQGTLVPLPTPTPTPTPDPTIVLQPLQTIMNEIRAATASSTVTDEGVTLIRLTLTVDLGIEGQQGDTQTNQSITRGSVVVALNNPANGYIQPDAGTRTVFALKPSIRQNSNGNAEWAVIINGPFDLSSGERWWLAIYQDESTIGFIRDSQVRSATITDIFPLDDIIKSVDSMQVLTDVVATGELEPIATMCAAFGVTTLVSDAIDDSTKDVQYLCKVTLALKDLVLIVAQRGNAPMVVVNGLNEIYGISETGLRELLRRITQGNPISCVDFSGLYSVTCNRVRSGIIVPANLQGQTIESVAGIWSQSASNTSLEITPGGQAIYHSPADSSSGTYQYLSGNRIIVFLGQGGFECQLTANKSLVCTTDFVSPETNLFVRQ